MSKEFDIIIPVGPDDACIVNHQLILTKKNIIGYRNIYLISYDKLIQIDGCVTISEDIFPFSIETVEKYHGKSRRNGWYLQQLLKLYAGIVIPGILSKYLVIDCDTFFLKPTTFIENGKCLYNPGTEYHTPYFDHMKKLDKSLVKLYNNMSGISHHMIIETEYINSLFNMVELNHNDTFYNVFLKNVTETLNSGASEYEIYFNFIFYKFKDNVVIRPLKWKNTNILDLNADYDYISYHSWSRQ